ncbi:MAG TPA: His/Gly/Thr/Pro-type tRNA ligase C-terminal domain-containing protein [Candidatus Babeliales bacterium]|nr:His/Gly/Thr/Pro-type tRNA ligase C-terminal domain-containing protein [Candidatus Babeliales bacterium]
MPLLLAQELNHKNLCVDVLLEQTSVKSMMRKANRLGAKFAVLIGESEQQAHVVTVKNMVNGTEETIKQVELTSYLLRTT